MKKKKQRNKKHRLVVKQKKLTKIEAIVAWKKKKIRERKQELASNSGRPTFRQLAFLKELGYVGLQPTTTREAGSLIAGILIRNKLVEERFDNAIRLDNSKEKS